MDIHSMYLKTQNMYNSTEQKRRIRFFFKSQRALKAKDVKKSFALRREPSV